MLKKSLTLYAEQESIMHLLFHNFFSLIDLPLNIFLSSLKYLNFNTFQLVASFIDVGSRLSTKPVVSV